MDGILSQDEISALLNGMDLSNSSEADPAPAAEETTAPVEENNQIDESLLSDTERDAIGEIANISMGSSATTLYSLVNRKVNITTPVVSLARWEDMVTEYEKPCVFIHIRYTAGLDGSNIMVLKEHDVKVIADLMMGGDGTNISDPIGEIHLSAISEAMNQMMGSAATSMSTMLGRMIDISPPEASRIDLNDFKQGGEIAPFLEETFVKITFRMQIDNLVESTIMQIYPIDFAKSLYNTFISNQSAEAGQAAPEPAKKPEPQPYVPPTAQMPQPDMSQTNMQMGQQPMMGQPMMNQPMMGQQPMMGMPMMNQPMMGQQPMMGMPMNGAMPQPMNIQPAQFQNFGGNAAASAGQENIGLIKDVPLEVTVELGRTQKSISEILDFAPGTIIELDKIAGEPIDVLVNGKFVAKGEVVVIEESFGIRVTEIVK